MVNNLYWRFALWITNKPESGICFPMTLTFQMSEMILRHKHFSFVCLLCTTFQKPLRACARESRG